MRPSTWNATGRITDAAVRVVNNVWRDTPAHARRRDGTCQDRCIPCAADTLRQALTDARTPGVLGTPQTPPPERLAPPAPGGGPTSPATAATHPPRAAGAPTDPDPCPMGCGHPTDDPYGGPCATCWDAAPRGRAL